jgi:hypothetical protein
MEITDMANKPSIRNRFTRRLAAKALGACMLAGLAVVGTTPAQAVIYMSPFGDNIIYGYSDGTVVSDPNRGNVTASAVPLFRVQTHVQDYGWINAFGTTGEGRRLEAIKVTQIGNPGLCLQVNVATLGWMEQQCTSGAGSTITVGTTGRSLAIQAVAATFNGCGRGEFFTAAAHLATLGWQTPVSSYCPGPIVVGAIVPVQVPLGSTVDLGSNVGYGLYTALTTYQPVPGTASVALPMQAFFLSID